MLAIGECVSPGLFGDGVRIYTIYSYSHLQGLLRLPRRPGFWSTRVWSSRKVDIIIVINIIIIIIVIIKIIMTSSSSCGVPARTKSGRIRTTLIGNPDIRFQANEGVQKSISNNIRWSWCLFIHVEEKKTNNSTLNSSRNPNKELQNEKVCSGRWWEGSLSCRAGRTGESESIEGNQKSPKTTFTWKAGAQAGTLVGNQKLSQK